MSFMLCFALLYMLVGTLAVLIVFALARNSITIKDVVALFLGWPWFLTRLLL